MGIKSLKGKGILQLTFNSDGQFNCKEGQDVSESRETVWICKCMFTG